MQVEQRPRKLTRGQRGGRAGHVETRLNRCHFNPKWQRPKSCGSGSSQRVSVKKPKPARSGGTTRKEGGRRDRSNRRSSRSKGEKGDRRPTERGERPSERPRRGQTNTAAERRRGPTTTALAARNQVSSTSHHRRPRGRTRQKDAELQREPAEPEAVRASRVGKTGTAHRLCGGAVRSRRPKRGMLPRAARLWQAISGHAAASTGAPTLRPRGVCTRVASPQEERREPSGAQVRSPARAVTRGLDQARGAPARGQTASGRAPDVPAARGAREGPRQRRRLPCRGMVHRPSGVGGSR